MVRGIGTCVSLIPRIHTTITASGTGTGTVAATATSLFTVQLPANIHGGLLTGKAVHLEEYLDPGKEYLDLGKEERVPRLVKSIQDSGKEYLDLDKGVPSLETPVRSVPKSR